MTKRFWFLLALLLFATICWSVENYQIFIAKRAVLYVFPTFENGYFEVDSIIERTWSDEPTPAARRAYRKGIKLSQCITTGVRAEKSQAILIFPQF